MSASLPGNDSSLVTVRVPEHSIPLMQALSSGKPFASKNYLFYHADDWLMAIGYPMQGNYEPEEFAEVLAAAEEEFQPRAVFAIAPRMPAGHERHIVETDRYYVLSANAKMPPRLRNQVRRASEQLTVVESAVFSAGHRRLWAEFLARNQAAMKDRVAELYAVTPKAMATPDSGLRLLDARDSAGNVVASLLLDYGPDNFLSYILGAHSRKFYVPHAADLLFARMLEIARDRGKRFIHLGLGVNDGILRFKKKWGAQAALPFVMAQWEREKSDDEPATRILARVILHSSTPSARQFLQNEPAQRPFAMLWRLEKNGRESWIGGTAHFFLYSFESSFRSLFRNVDNVLFEGPLDADFMARVDQAGKQLASGLAPLIEQMTEAEIRALERTVHGPRGAWARILGMERRPRADTRWLLRSTMPWYAFFTLWTSFLERLGWRQSVDMEAWRIANEMKKNVRGMENLEEQLESLASLPPQRALNFFRSCRTWKARARHNLAAYLAGDLERMMGSSAEFPTRTEHIVSRRDQRFRERMRPWLEKGGTAVFVGSAHMVNLRQMLAEDGFSVRQAPFGIWPRVQLGWRNISRPDEKVKW